MRALVTGACGFVGRYLVRHLLECGDRVLGSVIPQSLLSGSSALRHYEFDHVDLDITDRAAFAHVLNNFQPEVVYHLAGMAFVPEAENNFTAALLANVAGTYNLYAACDGLSSPVTVVLVSSAEVYGKVQSEDLPLTEASPVQPANNYSLSKVMAELVAQRFQTQARIRSVIVRPFNHIGPGQNERFVAANFAAQLVKIAHSQEPPVLRVGNLSARRDFSDVRDIVRAYRLAAERGSGVYNLGSGRSYPVRELLELLIEASGLQVQIETDPARVRRLDQLDVFGSYEKAKRDLGWQPSFSLRETLRDIYHATDAAFVSALV